MTDEITVGRSSARVLAARAPGWMVWYGERTGSYWAVPRAATSLRACLIEARTPGDLEGEIRRYQGGAPDGSRSQTQPQPEPGTQNQAQTAVQTAVQTQHRTGAEDAQTRHGRLPQGAERDAGQGAGRREEPVTAGR
ncbi:hypothetical protein [Microbispora sp. NPDC049125]|uniref:hypothetical protein n=1 Tax=Microbispora sp. NPDC049125 TaxID=3154929 RepID=UPI003465CCBB